MLVLMARAQLAVDRADEARLILEPLVEGHPDQVDAHVLLSEACAREGGADALKQARKWLDRAVGGNPTSAKALACRARFLEIHAGDRKAAEADMKAVESLRSPDPAVRLLMFDLFMGRGAWARAEAQLAGLEAQSPTSAPAIQAGADSPLASLDNDPDTVALLILKARASLALRRADSAMGVAVAEEGLARLAPEQRRLFLPVAAELYLLDRRLDRAGGCIDEYARTLDARNVTSPAARETLTVLRAGMLIQDAKANPFPAIEELQKLVTASPANGRAWRLLANGYLRAGQPLRMIQSLEQYLEKSPPDAESALLLAQACLNMDPSKALKYAAWAEQACPEDPNAKLTRIEAQLGIRDKDAHASVDLGTIAAELPELAKARPDSTRLAVIAARLAVAGGDYARAMNELSRSMKDGDQKLQAAMQLYKYARAAGDLDQAAAAAREAVQLRPDLAIPRVLLADAQESLEHRPQAQATLERAVADLSGTEQLTARVALAQFMIMNGRRTDGIAALQALATANPANAQLRLGLLKLPEIQASPAEAQRLVDELKAIEGEKGLLWRVEQAALWLRSDQWQAHVQETEETLLRAVNADPAHPQPVLLLGRFYELQGNPQKAEELYRRSIEGRPAHVSVLIRIVDLLGSQGRFVDAAALLRTIPPDVPALTQARTEVALGLGRHEDAIAELSRRIAAAPDDARARVMLAQLTYAHRKDAAKALELLDQVETLAPGDIAALSCRVAILHAEGREAQAITALDAAVARGDSASRLLRARYHADNGRAAQAEADYKLLAADQRMGGRGPLLLGEFYSRQGRPAEAIAAWESGSAAWPKESELPRRVVQALLADPDAEAQNRGLAMLTGLLQATPNDAGLLYTKARFILDHRPAERGQVPGLLEQIVRVDPRHVPAFLELIREARDSGDLARARELAARASGANPNQPDLLCMQARCEADAGNTIAAAGLVERVVQSTPRSLEARNLLVTLTLATGDLNAAERHNAEALTIDSGDAAAITDRATVLDRRGQRAEAQAWIQQQLAKSPKDRQGPMLVCAARLHLANKDYDRAEEALDAAAALEPESVPVAQARIECLAAQQRYDDLAVAAEGIPRGQPAFAPVLEQAAEVLGNSGRAGDLPSAVDLAQRALDAAPRRLSAAMLLARLNWGAGNVPAAGDALRKVLEIEPYHPKATNDLAWIVGVVSGKVQEGYLLADEGVRRHPRNPHLRDTRAALLIRLGRGDEAVEDLEACLELATDEPATRASALRHLAQALAARGDRDQARQRLAQAMETDRKYKVLAESDRAEIQKLTEMLK